MLGFLGGGSSGHIVDSSDLSDDDDLSDAVDGVRLPDQCTLATPVLGAGASSVPYMCIDTAVLCL